MQASGNDKVIGIRVTVSKAEEQTLEQVVDGDLDGFEAYFCGELKNASLSGPERAIIKTYLYFKTVVEPRRESERSASHHGDGGLIAGG